MTEEFIYPISKDELFILILEDVPSDAELAERMLKRENIPFKSKRVETREEFMEALENDKPDLIISDYTLPSFTGMEALEIANAHYPDIPYIFVSGTIGEERAVESLKKGATDYILKGNLKRLPHAVKNALQAAKAKIEKKQVLEELRTSQRILSEAETIGKLGSFEWDLENDKITWSDQLYRIFGLQKGKFTPSFEHIIQFTHPEDRALVEYQVKKAITETGGFDMEQRIVLGDDKVRFLAVKGRVEYSQSKKPLRMIGMALDISERKKAEIERDELLRDLEKKVKERTSELEEKNFLLKHEVRERKRVSEELEEKNKDLTDSLNYAKRIQEAVLPEVPSIKKHFTDCFVLNLPRDIVSGDFYWFCHHEDTNISCIAAVDCTGHGVPGALMSIMGADFLTQFSSEQGEKEPSEVLSLMDNQVRHNLKNTEEGFRMNDGMELALCSIDHKKNLLTFAGANRPLYLIRNNELQIFKGSRNPIGGYLFNEEDRSYEQTRIPLFPGDQLYMFSDGYVDQFGGPYNKKFMRLQFRELLLDMSSQPMEKQKDILQRSLNIWKRNFPQVDDILILGLKV